MDKENNQSSTGRNKILIIGLDGATYDYLLPAIRAGWMPNLAKFLDDGTWADLDSTIPPLSAPAWTTFLTGKFSGKHGIFHFFERDRPGQEYSKSQVICGNNIRTFTIWDWLSLYDRRIISVNVPMTYPPRPLNGLLITGMMTPHGATDITYPPELALSLKNYQVDLDYFLGEEQFDWRYRPEMEIILGDLIKSVSDRTQVALDLMTDNVWDCFMIVFSETDRLGHHFWKYVENMFNVRSELSEKIQEFFFQIDQTIDQLRQVAGQDVPAMIISDHGMGPIPQKQVHIGDWLYKMGLTTLQPSRSKISLQSFLALVGLSKDTIVKILQRVLSVRVIDKLAEYSASFNPQLAISSSMAIAIPLYESVVGIDLISSGDEAARQNLIERLRHGLLDIIDPDTFESVVEHVYQRDELFSGQYTDLIPDLLIVLKSGYEASAKLGHRNIVSTRRPSEKSSVVTGSHQPQGIFMASGFPLKKLNKMDINLSLADLMPTILYLLDLDIPENLDGKVRLELFEKTYIREHPIRNVKVDEEFENRNVGNSEMTQNDDDLLRERLRGLGYL